MFLIKLDNPSDALTGLPVVDLDVVTLGLESPPWFFHKSYSTLEAKKSPVCSTDINAVFCLEDSTLLKK